MIPDAPQARTPLARALFPDLAAELDTAFEHHRGAGVASGFDTWLDDAARTMFSAAGFDDIADPSILAGFDRVFALSRSIAPLLGTRVPEPEAFAEAGVDFALLEESLGSESDLAIVPTPHGLGARAWQSAFASVSSHSDALATGVAHDESPLLIATEALQEFSLLDTVPAGAPTADLPGGARWTLRLVPAGEKPATLGLGFMHGPHVTLPEMLMLQLLRVASGEPPVDSASFTWLAGSLAGGRLAARHVYDTSERVIRITCREIGSQGPHLGSRTPVG